MSDSTLPPKPAPFVQRFRVAIAAVFVFALLLTAGCGFWSTARSRDSYVSALAEVERSRCRQAVSRAVTDLILLSKREMNEASRDRRLGSCFLQGNLGMDFNPELDAIKRQLGPSLTEESLRRLDDEWESFVDACKNAPLGNFSAPYFRSLLAPAVDSAILELQSAIMTCEDEGKERLLKTVEATFVSATKLLRKAIASANSTFPDLPSRTLLVSGSLTTAGPQHLFYAFTRQGSNDIVYKLAASTYLLAVLTAAPYAATAALRLQGRASSLDYSELPEVVAVMSANAEVVGLNLLTLGSTPLSDRNALRYETIYEIISNGINPFRNALLASTARWRPQEFPTPAEISRVYGPSADAAMNWSLVMMKTMRLLLTDLANLRQQQEDLTNQSLQEIRKLMIFSLLSVVTSILAAASIVFVLATVSLSASLDREKQESAKRRKLARVLLHETRVPLSGLSMGLSLLLEEGDAAMTPLAQSQKAILLIMQDSVHRLSRLCTDSLSLEKVESGASLPFVPRIGSLKEEIGKAADELRSVAEAKGVRVVVAFLEEPLASAFLDSAIFDPDRVRQVVLNCLSNAIRHSKAGDSIDLTAFARPCSFDAALQSANGGVSLACLPSVTRRKALEDGDVSFSPPPSYQELLGGDVGQPLEAVILIRDTGPGIPEDKLHLLFRPFCQLSNGRDGEGASGSGLGLAISRSLARLMHGSLTAINVVASAEGPSGGAQFTFSFPTYYCASQGAGAPEPTVVKVAPTPLQVQRQRSRAAGIELTRAPAGFDEDDDDGEDNTNHSDDDDENGSEIHAASRGVSAENAEAIDTPLVTSPASGKRSVDRRTVAPSPSLSADQTAKRRLAFIASPSSLANCSPSNTTAGAAPLRKGKVAAVATANLSPVPALPPPAPSFPSAIATAQGPFAGRGLRVLVADDTASNLLLLVKMLGNLGITDIDTASDGEEALRLFRANPSAYYSAMLLDRQMPFLDGVSATRQLRASGFNGPIIAVSADADEGFIKAGANALLFKPLTKAALLAMLHKHLG